MLKKFGKKIEEMPTWAKVGIFMVGWDLLRMAIQTFCNWLVLK